MTVRVEEQVAAFIGGLAPDQRRRLRQALRDLAADRGDVKGLEPPLEGYHRLRVGPFRVLFRRERDAVYCVFAERRGIVYEVFAEMLERVR